MGCTMCPECRSVKTRRLGVRDLRWKPGHQLCDACGYYGPWSEFMWASFAARAFRRRAHAWLMRGAS